MIPIASSACTAYAGPRRSRWQENSSHRVWAYHRPSPDVKGKHTTHALQMLQWLDRGGRQMLQVLQYFVHPAQSQINTVDCCHIAACLWWYQQLHRSRFAQLMTIGADIHLLLQSRIASRCREATSGLAHCAPAALFRHLAPPPARLHVIEQQHQLRRIARLVAWEGCRQGGSCACMISYRV